MIQPGLTNVGKFSRLLNSQPLNDTLATCAKINAVWVKEAPDNCEK